MSKSQEYRLNVQRQPDLTDEDRAAIAGVLEEHGMSPEAALSVDAELYRAGLAAGRERAIEECARVCDDAKPQMYGGASGLRKDYYDMGCDNCAAAIRALK